MQVMGEVGEVAPALPTTRFTAWTAHETIGGIELADGALLRVQRCYARGEWFTTLQTLRRVSPPGRGWTLRSQTILPRDKTAALCALLTRTVEEQP